jgi:lipopolysaccharide export LptBFGC system permease protein LptF
VGLRTHDASAPEILFRAVILLLPQALVLTLPPSLLIALPLAIARRFPSARLVRRTIVLSLACVVATGALLTWAMPRANQAFRVLMSGNERLVPGPNESSLTALRERIAVLNLTSGGAAAARPLEFLLHSRVALVLSPLPFAWLALALVRTSIGRRRPWLSALAGLGVVLLVWFPLELVGQTMAAGSRVPAALFAWLPTLAVFALAAIISRAAHESPVGAPA